MTESETFSDKPCRIELYDSSCQPVTAPRCVTCGRWRSKPCKVEWTTTIAETNRDAWSKNHKLTFVLALFIANIMLVLVVLAPIVVLAMLIGGI